MGKATIKWKGGSAAAAMRIVRSMPEVVDAVEIETIKLAFRAGDGYEAEPVEITGGRERARGAIVTVTSDAIRNEARNHTLARLAN